MDMVKVNLDREEWKALIPHAPPQTAEKIRKALLQEKRQRDWEEHVKPLIDYYNRLLTLGAGAEELAPYREDVEEAKRLHREKYEGFRSNRKHQHPFFQP